MIITPQNYDAAEAWCHEVASSSNHAMFYNPAILRQVVHQKALELEFPISALQSLIRNESVNHIKKAAPAIKRNLGHYLEQYKQGTSILQLAKNNRYSPYMLARYIVNEITTLGRGGRSKKILSEAMRNPEGILGNVEVIAEAFRRSEQQQKVSKGPRHEDEDDRHKKRKVLPSCNVL